MGCGMCVCEEGGGCRPTCYKGLPTVAVRPTWLSLEETVAPHKWCNEQREEDLRIHQTANCTLEHRR